MIWSSRPRAGDGGRESEGGGVLYVDETGVVVSTGQGALELGEVGFRDEDMDSVDFARRCGVVAGQRFENVEVES